MALLDVSVCCTVTMSWDLEQGMNSMYSIPNSGSLGIVITNESKQPLWRKVCSMYLRVDWWRAYGYLMFYVAGAVPAYINSSLLTM
jgi:hypothetical protein